MGLTDNLQLLTRLELQEWQPASAPVNLHQLCDDVPRDRYQRGSGLTWFLCDQLCRRVGGRLAIQSRMDIGTRYTLSLPLAPLEGDAGDEAEELLEDTLVLLDIRNEEIRAIVSGMLEQWGAECVYVDEHHLGQEHDLLMTDDPARMEDYAPLLDGDAQGVMALATRRIKLNYNFSAPMLEAILQLIEQRLGDPEEERDQATGEPMSAGDYQNRLQDSDYYALFVETVPDDVKRLYTEAESGDLNALAQTAHRLKEVFAMLGLEPAKRARESLELYIKQQDIAKMGSEIHQIDVFVTKMLQHAR